jgi:carboxymethylenebutenolidase
LFRGVSTATETTFVAQDGRRIAAHRALPDGTGPHAGVLVIHEVFGLNDDMRRICARLADHGYAAFAPDLFDRSGSRASRVARAVWSLRTGTGEIFDDLGSARRALAAEETVDAARLGVVGFCMGGGFALRIAMLEPFRVTAPFYGGVPRDVKRLEGICPVVASYGARDRVYAPHGRRLKRHLEQLGVAHDVKIYPEAGHGFMSHRAEPNALSRLGRLEPLRAAPHEPSAEDAWRRMLAFFDAHLRPPPEPPPGLIQENRNIEGE